MAPDDQGRPRGPVGWADALTAAARLGLTTREQFSALAALLDLTAPEPGPRTPVTAPGPPGPAIPAPAVPELPWASQPADGDELLPVPDRRTVVDVLPDEPVELIQEDQQEPPVLPSGAGRPAVPYVPPVPAPQLRAAVTMLIRRPRLADDLDAEAAITLIAEQHPLDELPRLLEHSTAGGATVLADTGPSMLPYLDDVARLVAECQHAVGASRLDVIRVEDGAGPEGDVPAIPAGRPVLIVSTVGATTPPGADPGTAARWHAFAAAATEAGADVTALVPHRGHRWPAGLRRAMRFVAWDDLAEAGRGHG